LERGRLLALWDNGLEGEAGGGLDDKRRGSTATGWARCDPWGLDDGGPLGSTTAAAGGEHPCAPLGGLDSIIG